MGPHQRMLLNTQLQHLKFLDLQIEQLTEEVEGRMRPFEEALSRLDAIPGIGQRSAQDILAEIGVDMTRFPSAAHLASWAGLCPGNNESAGKRKNTKTRKGSPHLRATLVEAARSASHVKGSYLSALYHRIAASKRAAVAVAHAILVIIYHMLKHNTDYQDLGPNYFDQSNRDAVVKRSIKRLEQLGYRITLEEVA